MAKAVKVSFEGLMNGTHTEAKAMEKERKELEKKARDLKSTEAEKYRALTRLNKIAYMANYTNGVNPMEWRNTVEKFEGHERSAGSERWIYREFWELETSQLDFDVYIQERLDLKKYKFEVKVYVRKTTLSEEPRSIHGGYTSFDYGKEKYMTYLSYGKYEPVKGQEMEMKFATMKEAQAFAEQWKDCLYNDHKEEIEEERRLRQLCIDTGYKYDDRRTFY